MTPLNLPPEKTLDLEKLQKSRGRVNHQPVSVRSFTNKRFTVNFRAPVEQVRRLLPAAIGVDEIPGTGLGMFGMCACDFHVTRFGWIPVPGIQNNDMLFRVSAQVSYRGVMRRAFYTIASNSSSPLLGFLGARFSHFRKRVSPFSRVDDGAVYQLKCKDRDPMGRGQLTAQIASISKDRPATTIFDSIEDATDFVFNLDGSCGYRFRDGKLSYQKIDYPEWEMYFCHDFNGEFPLLDYLVEALDIDAVLDCVLFMEKTPQTWRSSWLYRNDSARNRRR